jgi:hypothetical protein
MVKKKDELPLLCGRGGGFIGIQLGGDRLRIVGMVTIHGVHNAYP